MANLTSQLLVRLIDGVSGPARKAAGALAGIGQAANRVGGLAGRLNAAVERNAAAMDKARGRMVDAMAMGYALARSLTAPVKAGIDFQTQLEDIGQKAAIPQEKLAALGARIRKVAADTTQAASQMAKGMDVLVGFGASEDDALAMLRPIGRAATAYGAQIEDLAQASYAALLNLKVPADQVATALDAMAQAGKSGAFELKDMARYAPAIFAAYQGLGQKGVPAVADLAAAMQVVRMGAGDSAEAATNLSNVLQKINAPATRRNFKKLGINLEKEMKKAAAKGMTPIEAIAEITNTALKGDLGKLGDLFEDAQVQKGLRAIIQNLDEYRKIRAEALKAQGVVEEDYQRRLKTTQGFVQRFRATMENLNISLGTALLPAINEIADRLSFLASKLADFAEAHPKLTRNVVMATSALISFRVALAGLQFLGLFAKGGALTLLAATFGRIAAAGSKMGGAVRATWALQAALAGGASYGGLAKAADALKAIARITPGLRLVGPAIGAIGAALGAITAPVAAVIAGIAAAGFVIYRYWDRLSAIFAGVARAVGDQLAPAFEAARPVLEWLAPVGDAIAWAWEKAASALSAVGDWFGSIFSRELLSEDQKAALEGDARDITNRIINGLKVGHGLLIDAGVQMIQSLLGGMASKIGEAVTWAATIPQRIRAAFGKIDFKDAVSIEALVAAFKSANAQIFAAGADMIQSLWDGMVSKVEQLIAWVKTIPARIKAAITTDLSGAIRGLIPSWAGGGGGGGGDSQPAVDGKRAGGGPVYPGRSYLVGEQGPEIITPSRSGYVHPNGSAPGGTYNIGVEVGVKIERDLSKAIDEIERQFSERLRASLRGLQADYGFGAA